MIHVEVEERRINVSSPSSIRVSLFPVVADPTVL